MNRHFLKSFPLLLVLLYTPAALAQWSVDNEASTLSFVTVKAEHVAEVHTFDLLEGGVSTSGDVDIQIQLASVNTMIPIRNERIQTMLFETNMFPTATVSASVDVNAIGTLASGDAMMMSMPFDLSIKGQTQSLMADVTVVRVSDGLMVSTVKPVIVLASAFDLVAGVEALREVAGLPSISQAVPVSFQLMLSE